MTARPKRPSRLAHILASLRRNSISVLGGAFLAAVATCAVFAPTLAPHDYAAVDILRRLAPASSEHLLGTDQYGRDILSRLLFGARTSLFVGLAATFCAGVLGGLVGAAAAWISGTFDSLAMRVMDVLLAFPAIVLAIALAAVFGPGLEKVILIISVSHIPTFARIVRASVLTLRSGEFVVAAVAIGRRSPAVLLRHVVPNALSPIVVYASLSVATAINMEAALSFLGLGIQPPSASWGTMLSDARQYMLVAPMFAIWPGLAITSTVLAFNSLGDALRDVLDPRLRGQL